MPDVNEHVKTFNVNSLYDENDPILNAEFKQLLKQHVDLDDAELIQHVRKFVRLARTLSLTLNNH